MTSNTKRLANALALAALALSLAACSGSGGGGGAKSAAKDDPANLLPAGANIVAFIDLREAMKGPDADAFASIVAKASKNNESFGKAMERTGFEPKRDIGRFALAVWETPAGMKDPGVVWIAETPLDLDKIMGAAKAAIDEAGNERDYAFTREEIGGANAWKVEWTRGRRRQALYAARQGGWILMAESAERMAQGLAAGRGEGKLLSGDPAYAAIAAKGNPKATLRVLAPNPPAGARQNGFAFTRGEANWNAEGFQLSLVATADDEKQADALHQQANMVPLQVPLFVAAADKRLAGLGSGWSTKRDGLDVSIEISWPRKVVEEAGEVVFELADEAFDKGFSK